MVAPGGLLLVLRLENRGVFIKQGVLRIGALERGGTCSGALIMLDELLVVDE